jgi:hypothetical protein
MAKDETKRLPPSTLSADRETFAALAKIANYSPTNAEYSFAALEADYKDMLSKQDIETQTAAAAAAARDAANGSEWRFHNRILGSKDQAVAQFGRDSDEIQALGLKKKAERKKPTRKKKGA